MKNSILLILLMLFFNSVMAQDMNKLPRLKVKFDPTSVTKLDPVTDTIIEVWATSNKSIYRIDRRRRVVNFVETDPQRKVVKSWSHVVKDYNTDKEVHKFTVTDDDGSEYSIVIWKDKTMVALVTNYGSFLVRDGTENK